jgi:hypothetical protein
MLRYACNPCSLVSSRTSWPPSSPAPGSLRLFAWVGAPFSGFYSAFRRARSRPHGSQAGSGLSTFLQSWPCVVLRFARNPCPFRQDRAPWPPSLLRQVPTRSRRASPSFPAVKRFPTGILYPSRLPTLGGPLYGSTAPVARDVLRSARYPCPYGLGQHLLAASIPAPGLSSHRVASPGAWRLSPRLWFPSPGLSPHGSWTRDEPFFDSVAVEVPRPARYAGYP